MTKPNSINKRKPTSRANLRTNEAGAVGKNTTTSTEKPTVYAGMSNYDPYTKTLVKSMQGEQMVKNTPSQRHIKIPTRVDYHPELCKDYLETGFCGFGDSCKFLHDRSDYKSGWQLEEEYNKQLEDELSNQNDYTSTFKIPQEALLSADSDEDQHTTNFNDVVLCPFCKCQIKNPVQTNCGHNYCQECAVTLFKSNALCVTCNSQLDGTLKPVNISEVHVTKKPDPPQEQKQVDIVNLVNSSSDTNSIDGK